MRELFEITDPNSINFRKSRPPIKDIGPKIKISPTNRYLHALSDIQTFIGNADSSRWLRNPDNYIQMQIEVKHQMIYKYPYE